MQQLEEARAPLLLYVQYEYLPVRHGAAILDSFSRVHEAVLIALRKDLDKFGCYGVPFRWGMSPSLEPHSKFIIGAEHSDDLRLRLGSCVASRRNTIHAPWWLT
jgi:hypothetical protein